MQLKKPKVFLHKGQFPNRLELSFVILSGQLANEEILHRSILGNTSIVLSVLSKVYVLLRLIFLELSSRLLKWAITHKYTQLLNVCKRLHTIVIGLQTSKRILLKSKLTKFLKQQTSLITKKRKIL